ncbi:MAG: lipopolysaccharide transport periplasmic protein LptA [Betaproteobacteria bacterium]|nr:lipopolysaccharide transport periplasmic protein LptA [Betaproteobacteria bacterium]
MKAILLAFSLCVLVAANARAEKADREKPIHIESNRVTVDEIKQLSVFEGNVILTQGTTVIRGQRMEVRQDKEGFRQGTVWGKPAYFKKKREGADEYIEGWGERVEYDGRADKLQLFVRAQLKRGGDIVTGDYISYDTATEFFQVIGGGTKAATENNPEGRVRTVIQPKPKMKPPLPPAVPLKPADGLAAPREIPVAPR